MAIAVGLAVSCCWAARAVSEEDFQARTYKSANGKTLNYRIHLPASIDAKKKYPLILFLHGAGERGSDNSSQLTVGVRRILEYSASNNSPAIIVAPQCPDKMQWVNTPWSANSHTMPPDPSVNMRLSLELLQQIITEQPVDTARIYVTGLSMGGFGTWDLMGRARRFRKMFGGGMRQAGIIGAGALFALENHRNRLADDHANARRLAGALARLPGIEMDPATVETNIVLFRLTRLPADEFVARMREAGILVLATGPQVIRAVTNLNVSADDIESMIIELRRVRI